MVVRTYEEVYIVKCLADVVLNVSLFSMKVNSHFFLPDRSVNLLNSSAPTITALTPASCLECMFPGSFTSTIGFKVCYLKSYKQLVNVVTTEGFFPLSSKLPMLLRSLAS